MVRVLPGIDMVTVWSVGLTDQEFTKLMLFGFRVIEVEEVAVPSVGP